MDVATQTPVPDKIARFLGRDEDYGRLVIRGNVLSAVTLGIYRFWFITDVRRFLWSNSEFGGETLEYTGRGLELFLGFLIGLAVLAPFYGVLLLLPSFKGFFGLFIFWLSQFAVYRARRYRLTRTVFRGVRLHQSGSAVSYAFRSMGWWILMFMTLGLAYPWAQASLERYKMRNTFYGDLPGRFENTGTSLFLSGIWMWLLIVGPFVGLLYAPVNWSTSGAETQYKAVWVAIVWGVLATLVLYPAFEAISTRWWLSGLRFGDIQVTSALRTSQIYKAWLRFLLFAVLLGFVAIVIILVVSVLFGSLASVGNILSGLDSGPPMSTAAQVATGGVLLLVYVAVALCYAALYQVFVRLAVWRFVVDSLEIANFQMIELVKAEGELSSPFGEGLADALDVGSV
jgi:uncharacterized membrane protein YjgN (DUF898 family)